MGDGGRGYGFNLKEGRFILDIYILGVEEIPEALEFVSERSCRCVLIPGDIQGHTALGSMTVVCPEVILLQGF